MIHKNMLGLKEALNRIPDEDLATANLTVHRVDDVEPGTFEVAQLRSDNNRLLAVEICMHYDD